MFVTSAILNFRCDHPEVFASGEYEPLSVTGPRSELVCAFDRKLGDTVVVVAAARFPARLHADPEWCGTTMTMPKSAAGKKWRDIFTGDMIDIAGDAVAVQQIFAQLPVAVLSSM